MHGALVILSGGQDSTTCLGWALRNYDRVACVTFDYGQRHDVEIAAAAKVVSFFEGKYNKPIPHEVVELGAGILQGSSPLTNPDEQLERYENHEQMEKVIGDRIEKTFVPMRNALFLTLAANRAVVGGYDVLVTGVCQGDNANYPDCRLKFIQAQERTINEALGRYHDDANYLVIMTPLMEMSKADSIQFALMQPDTYEALAFSHTAYDGAFPPTNDHASVLRAHGFDQAGIPDPLILRAYATGRLAALPDTHAYRDTVRIKAEIARMRVDWA